jgi:hypothetical protein
MHRLLGRWIIFEGDIHWFMVGPWGQIGVDRTEESEATLHSFSSDSMPEVRATIPYFTPRKVY